MNDERFEELLGTLREESAPGEQVEKAQERVWQQLAAARPLACQDFTEDLKRYARGDLSDARRLLIEDHVARCVACRRALNELKGTRKVVALPTVRPRRRPAWQRWAVAAGVVLAMLYISRPAIDSALAPSGPRATVVSVSGTLYEPSGTVLAVGAELGEAEVVRTAAGSVAILELRDGSRVELNQRTELAVRAARSGDTIHLDRGDIIVQAAEQGRNRLRVVTRDSIASVKGTVFGVSTGTAGSLVSVVEGSVEVAHTGYEALLTAGETAASSPALASVGVVEAVSWSQEAGDYYALLAEFAQIEEELARSGPSMRTDASLVSYLPANTSVYFAIPNLDGTIEEALRLVEQRSVRNATLRSWLESGEGREMMETLGHLQSVTGLLGDEMVVAVVGGKDPQPLFMARVRSGSDAELLRTLQSMMDEAGDDVALPFQVTEELFLAAESAGDLAMLSAQLGSGATSPFANEIKAHYGRGVGWMAAIDVAALNRGFPDDQLADMLGITSMRYLFVEQRSTAAGDESEATLSFSGARSGMASWVAAPGPIGAAEYVSTGAIAASAGSTQDPREAFDQLLAGLGADSEFMRELRELEQETGIDIRDDIAASLGTDFVMAVEGVSINGLDWVAAFEVINPSSLDAAMQRMVDMINAELHDTQQDERVAILEEEVNGRTWKTLSAGVENPSVLTWTYDRGYMVTAMNRANAVRAIGVRDSSSSLTRSSKFLSRFPAGGSVHESGFLWLDPGAFGAILETLGKAPLGLENNRDPVLVVITGGEDQIRWASRTRLTSLIFDFLLM